MARIEIVGRVCWAPAPRNIKGRERIVFVLAERRRVGATQKTEHYHIYSNDLSLLGRIKEGDQVRVIGELTGASVHYHSRNYDLHVWATTVEPGEQEMLSS